MSHDITAAQIEQSSTALPPSSTPLKRAAITNPHHSKRGLQERLFAFFFDGLVYPQIWEDPVVDMAAMEIEPSHHIVAIASGGCNIMSYLAAGPAKITAVDLNKAHLALLELKLAAARNLETHDEFRRFFAVSDDRKNLEIFEKYIKSVLPEFARDYWSGPRVMAKPRVNAFSKGFYRHGLLGRYIAAGHVLGRLYGINPAEIAKLETLADQQRYFDEKISPLFDRKFVRWITSMPTSLYGLGIPPAQYEDLAGGRHMADVLRERLGKLTCGFPLSENYFARQAFARSYGNDASAQLPPYLEAVNWPAVKSGADKVRAVNLPVTELLDGQAEGSVDRFVYLDAQDWMTVTQINDLWRATTRAAAHGARVIFRSAAEHSPVEHKVDPTIRTRWSYDVQTSRKLHEQDRSAIYGGFHIYRRKP